MGDLRARTCSGGGGGGGTPSEALSALVSHAASGGSGGSVAGRGIDLPALFAVPDTAGHASALAAEESAGARGVSVWSAVAPTGREWRDLFRCYGAHGRAKEAVSLARDLRGAGRLTLDEGTYCSLIAAAGDSGDAGLAQRLFDAWRVELSQAPACGTSPFAASAAARGVKQQAQATKASSLSSSPGRVTDEALALALFQAPSTPTASPGLGLSSDVVGRGSSGVEPSTGSAPGEGAWSALVHALVRCGDVDRAFAAASRMETSLGGKTTLAACTSLLAGLAKHASPATAFERASDLWFGMRLKGVEPSLLTYTAYVQCACKSREVERALNLLEEMRQEKVKPSVVTYNVVLRGLTVAPQWHRSLALAVDEVRAPDASNFVTSRTPMHL